MGGSIIMMISIENRDEKRAYYGYIIMAMSIWLHCLFLVLSLILTFLWSPKYFFRNLIGTLLTVIIIMSIYIYSSWIEYCYTKHLSNGHRDIVESVKSAGLISKEQIPEVMSGPTQTSSVIRRDMNNSDVEKR